MSSYKIIFVGNNCIIPIRSENLRPNSKGYFFLSWLFARRVSFRSYAVTAQIIYHGIETFRSLQTISRKSVNDPMIRFFYIAIAASVSIRCWIPF